MHSRHAVAALSFMNLPGAHSSHLALPASAAWLPGRQLRHTEALELPEIGLALPEAHAWHAALLELPRSGLNVPASHGSKVCRALAAPVAAQKPPDGQRSHVVELRASLSLPAGQAEQLVLAGSAL